jgi:hypothetical protein
VAARTHYKRDAWRLAGKQEAEILEKNKEYFKGKDNDLETNVTNKLIRGVYRDTD